MIYTPYPYQRAAEEWILSHASCGLFLGMGMGKTVCTLTALERLLYERFTAHKVLIVAPKRVAETTWTTEAAKWEHLGHLRISRVLGTARARADALAADADIYIASRDCVPWLCAYLADTWDFDTVVLDELSSFKSPNAMRFKALRKMRCRISRVIGLTGTPAPNGLIDLWSQIYLLDCGARLGKTIGSYRDTYFLPERTSGHIVYSYRLRPGADTAIYAKLADLCMSLCKEDRLHLPDRIYETVRLEPPKDLLARYRRFVKDAVLSTAADGRGEIVAGNAATLTGKLLQFASGAVYDDSGAYTVLHDLKLDALSEMVEAAAGEPMLIFYAFRSDRDRILSAIPDAHVLSTAEDIEKWNAGKIPVAIAHPASVGHGLNLQDGGHIIVWFGLTWSLELYQQANERLNRPGQKHVCRIYHLILGGTYEERVLRALAKKDTSQRALLAALAEEVRDCDTEGTESTLISAPRA